MKVFLLISLLFIARVPFAGTYGPAVPVAMLQEAGVVHVHMPSNAPRSGIPGCASRVYIDLSTDAGRFRASMAMTALVSGKTVKFVIPSTATSCQWSSSIPNSYMSIQ